MSVGTFYCLRLYSICLIMNISFIRVKKFIVDLLRFARAGHEAGELTTGLLTFTNST